MIQFFFFNENTEKLNKKKKLGDDNYLHMVRTNLTGQAQTIAHMQQLDNSPNFFHRNHLLRSSDNEKYSK